MYQGKKVLLILGAISAMNEIVIKAKQKGYYTIVTDYYADSPAKKYADESWMLSIDDVDAIVEKAKKRMVDGVMNYCIDPGQKPYQQICEKLGVPCVAGFEQFDIMTNKDKFAGCCERYGVDIIPKYRLDENLRREDIEKIIYPVIIKPADGRASKGISICYKEDELERAVQYALSCSKRKKVIAETYLECPEICVKYFACEREFYLTSMADVFKCYTKDGEKVYLGTQTYPSRFFDEYIRTTHDKVVHMLQAIGIENGATSLTGFYDNGVFRFFDPSLRMGGAQDWKVVEAASGIDISDLLTDFAMTGKMGKKDEIKKIDRAIINRYSALLYFDIGTGIIGKFSGIEEAQRVSGVVGYHQCHVEGDEIHRLGTADNVAIRFILSCDTHNELINSIKKIEGYIKIEDVEGKNMIISPFNPEELKFSGGYC